MGLGSVLGGSSMRLLWGDRFRLLVVLALEQLRGEMRQ